MQGYGERSGLLCGPAYLSLYLVVSRDFNLPKRVVRVVLNDRRHEPRELFSRIDGSALVPIGLRRTSACCVVIHSLRQCARV